MILVDHVPLRQLRLLGEAVGELRLGGDAVQIAYAGHASQHVHDHQVHRAADRRVLRPAGTLTALLARDADLLRNGTGHQHQISAGMGRRNGLVEVVQRAVQRLERRHEDRHRMRLAACHDGGDSHVLHRHALSGRSGGIRQHRVLGPRAVFHHLLIARLRRRDDRKTVADVHLVEVIVDLFHVGAGLGRFLFTVLRHEREEAVRGRRHLVDLEIDVGQLLQLFPVLRQGAEDVIPLQVNLLGNFFHRAALIDVHGAQAQMAGAVHAHAFRDRGSRRCRHVDGWNAQLFKGDRHNGRGRRGAHVAERHDGRRRLFLGQHRRVLVQALLVLAAHRLRIFYEVRDAQFRQALLDPVKYGIVVAKSQFRVVVEKDLALLQFLQRRSCRQLDHRPFLDPSRVQQFVQFHSTSLLFL